MASNFLSANGQSEATAKILPYWPELIEVKKVEARLAGPEPSSALVRTPGTANHKTRKMVMTGRTIFTALFWIRAV
jgi:hypothetical protein